MAIVKAFYAHVFIVQRSDLDEDWHAFNWLVESERHLPLQQRLDHRLCLNLLHDNAFSWDLRSLM